MKHKKINFFKLNSEIKDYNTYVPNGSTIVYRHKSPKKYKIAISNSEYNRRIKSGKIKVYKISND